MVQTLSQEELLEILQAFASSRFAHLELTLGTARVTVDRADAASAPGSEPSPSSAEVSSPLLGTFEASPQPGAPAFVQPGSEVQPDTTVGAIRIMGRRTTVKAGVHGTVVDVVVRDGQFVEFGQTLVRVRTDGDGQRGPRERGNGSNAR